MAGNVAVGNASAPAGHLGAVEFYADAPGQAVLYKGTSGSAKYRRELEQ